MPEIIEKYNDFAASKNTELILGIKTLKDKLSLIERSINNIINVIIETGSRALSDKLKELETEKALLEQSLSDKNQELSQMTVDEKELKKAFRKARKMLESGTLANRKAIIQHYVKQVIVHKGKIVIEFNITDNFTITEEIERP